MLGVCSIMGLPWFVAATVLSISHVNSLKVESECAAPGEQPKFLGIREQRVTGFMIFILMGCSVFMTSALKVTFSQYPFIRSDEKESSSTALYLHFSIILTMSVSEPWTCPRCIPFVCLYNSSFSSVFSLSVHPNACPVRSLPLHGSFLTQRHSGLSMASVSLRPFWSVHWT